MKRRYILTSRTSFKNSNASSVDFFPDFFSNALRSAAVKKLLAPAVERFSPPVWPFFCTGFLLFFGTSESSDAESMQEDFSLRDAVIDEPRRELVAGMSASESSGTGLKSESDMLASDDALDRRPVTACK